MVIVLVHKVIRICRYVSPYLFQRSTVFMAGRQAAVLRRHGAEDRRPPGRAPHPHDAHEGRLQGQVHGAGQGHVGTPPYGLQAQDANG